MCIWYMDNEPDPMIMISLVIANYLNDHGADESGLRNRLDKKDKFGESKYAKALRYGDVAVAMICKYSFYKEDVDIEYIEKKVNTILTKWSSFESFAFSKKTNIKYFDKKASEFNYYGYYKGSTINKDLLEFF